MDPGFDLVVATTQGALNTTILNYLDKTEQKTQQVFYISRDDPKDPSKEEIVAISELEFKEKNKDIDVFSISAEADPAKDEKLLALREIGFSYAIVSLFCFNLAAYRACLN
jgi:hypothetical protein